MTTSSSEITVIPKRFSGIRVLLIEPEESLLVQHAYMLSQNSYKVTSTTKASTGLAMIQNGHLYDCVLVDVDIREMDMVDFIHQVLNLQPELSIIMMMSDDIHMMRFVTEALKNEAILCLVKPCDLSEICNIWNHVCRKRIASEQHDSKGKLPLANNIIRRVDPMFKSFPTLNRAMTNNGMSQEYGAMFKPVDMNFGANKGKQPMNNDQPLENDIYQKRRKESKPRINWTKALHGKFLEALNTLGEQNAYPSEILKHMNVSGLTRNHVASHLQKLNEGEKIIKKPRLVPMVQIGDNLQEESYNNKKSGQFTLTTNNGSIIQSNSFQRPLGQLNSAGNAYMSIDNIKARLQESAFSLPVPQPTTTTMSNSGGGQVTDHSSNTSRSSPTFLNGNSGVGSDQSGSGFSEALTPLCFDTYNSLNASCIGDMSEPLAQFDCFGIPIDTMEPPVGDVVVEEENCNMGAGETSIVSPITNSRTGGGGGGGCGGSETSTSTANQSVEDMMLHEFVSHELGGLYCQPEELQGNEENLLMGFLHHSDTPSLNGVSTLGLEAATEDDPFLHMTQFDVEGTMQLLDEVDTGDLINGP